MKKLLVVLMFGTVLWAAPANGHKGGCELVYRAYAGKPTAHGQTVLADVRVPADRRWKLTNVSLLAERHTGGELAEAGEWTAQLAAASDGQPGFTIAQSSLESNNGIALQGQGAINVTLDEGDLLRFSVWLRDGTDPINYYYTLSASGMDCPL